MRVFDFLSDIRETSQRIAARGPVIDSYTAVDLTMKTLMRQDVVSYIGRLAGDKLPRRNLLVMYYVVVFAYLANARPAPLAKDASKFAVKAVRALIKAEAKGGIICTSGKPQLPRSLVNALKPFMAMEENTCLECRLEITAPDAGRIISMSRSENEYASLILFPWRAEIAHDLPPVGERIIYSDLIFLDASGSGVGGIYVSSSRLTQVQPA